MLADAAASRSRFRDLRAGGQVVAGLDRVCSPFREDSTRGCIGKAVFFAEEESETLGTPTRVRPRSCKSGPRPRIAWKEEIVTFPWYFSGGLVWFGPMDARKNDRVALGFANAWFSDDLPAQSTETVLSTTYTYHVNDVLEVSPDVQYILHQPGGTGDVDDAFLLGLLFYITL